MDKRKLKLILGVTLQELVRGLEGFDLDCIEGAKIKDQEILEMSYSLGRLEEKDLEKTSLAYISYCAASMALSMNQRKDALNSIKGEALESIFNYLNGNKRHGVYKMKSLNHLDGINYPLEEALEEKTEEYLNSCNERIKAQVKTITLTKEDLQAFYQTLERDLTYLPGPQRKEELKDISLYDHIKMTACLATCIYDYIKEKNLKEYFLLAEDCQTYVQEDIFYLYSFDFSGIQNFIYTISSDKALRSLRTRSFYLEVLLEYSLDTLLDRLNLLRTNILYTGGGHCYLLLPNTRFVKETVQNFKEEVNQWLLDFYSSDLYLAGAGQACQMKDFEEGESENYQKVFQSLSNKLSENKLHRYNSRALNQLNFLEHVHGSRECKICKRVDQLVETEAGLVCQICQDIQDFSREILRADFFAVVKDEKEERGLPLPFQRQLVPIRNEEDLRKKRQDTNFIRAYGKNNQYFEEKATNHLWIGDYAYDQQLSLLSQGAEGIPRLGVIRADVDNLGQAFVQGFSKEYASLIRSASFSRNMSLFFKYHINDLLENGQFSITDQEGPIKRKALIVYSGGDDLFIVGAWKDIIEFSVDLVRSLEKFTLNSLTLSAGIGIFSEKFPLKSIAHITGDLENQAKSHVYFENGQEKKKNSVCLFERGQVYSWQDFQEKVLGEKLSLLTDYFTEMDDRGKSFLYRILDLLRSKEKDRLNIARLAYLLARLEPRDNKQKEKHQEFSKKIYRYAKEDKDRRELITAIYILVYLERKKDGTDQGKLC